MFLSGTIRNFQALSNRLPSLNQLRVGPWHHIPGVLAEGEHAEGASPKVIDDWQLKWFDRHLRGLGNETGPGDRSPVAVYCPGGDAWLSFENWPPAETREIKLYLESRGRAQSSYGDGRLSYECPQENTADVFVYDPAFPVQSAGGHSCCWPAVAPMGARDQRCVEASSAVLIYTTDPLSRDLLVAGATSADLYAATTAVDTDWVGRLCDVDAAGRSVNVQEGVVRARFRSGMSAPTLLEPGEPEHYTIRMGNACYRFRRGHRVRLQITSSSFPTWEPNPNTGSPLGIDSLSSRVIATQSVLHGTSYPSALRLPVIE